jgi:predicted Rdx family selenoprotein
MVMQALSELYKKGFFSCKKKIGWRGAIFSQAIINVFNPPSVIDVGCAIGEVPFHLSQNGVDAMGLEGSPVAKLYTMLPVERQIWRDLRIPFPSERLFDLAICFEVAEHIDEEYADIFVGNLVTYSNKILMSAALPGQGGQHHVNCQPPKYWEEKLVSRGFSRNVEVEKSFKDAIELYRYNRDIRAIYQNLLFFEKTSSDKSSDTTLQSE